MPELKRALGTQVDVTVFRKLKHLAYRTSYSHRGSYYTLDETAHFDENGLWSFQSVWFSRQGTLLDTAQAFVENSSAGHSAEELDHLLHVGTKEPLLRLVQHERVARQPVEGVYLYCSMNPVLRQRQLLARHVLQAEPNLASSLAKAEVVSDELKAAIVLFSSMLDEKQRRLHAGLESLKLGYGGDQRIAEFIGMDPHIIQVRLRLQEQLLRLQRLYKGGVQGEEHGAFQVQLLRLGDAGGLLRALEAQFPLVLALVQIIHADEGQQRSEGTTLRRSLGRRSPETRR
jgi:hypothetical protein